MDNSGRDQVAVANFASDSVSVLSSDGRGGLDFVATAPLAAGANPTYLAPIRGFGASPPDLVVSDNGTAKVTYLNYLSGGFQLVADHAVGTNPNQIVAADFDGNGRDDFAVANFSSNSVSVYSGINPGVPLTPAPDVTGVSQPVGLATADVNGDLDLDLLIGANGDIYVALGQTGVTFAAPVAAAVSAGLNRDLAVGDFNRDGDPDLAVAVNANPGVRAFMGGAGATFGAAIALFSNLSRGVAAADVTGDDVPDVIAVDELGQAPVLESRGDGTFMAAMSAAVTASVFLRDVETLDLDGDGDRDVVISNQTSPGEVLIAENTSLSNATLSAAALAFADQPAGTTGPVAAVTVTNSGGARPLHVGVVSVTGGDDFGIAGDECSGATVPQGGSCRIGVRFSPGSPGAKGATLRIVTDAPGSPHTVALSGTGSSAPVGPQGPAGAAGAPGAAGAAGADLIRLVVALFDTRLRGTAGRALTLRFAITAPASLTLDVLQGRRRTRVARITGRAARAGAARIAWNGKVRGRAAPAGSYSLRLRAVAADGKTVTATVAATLVRPRPRTTRR
jgi:hypothetical protein